MEFLFEYGLFLVKTITLVAAVGVVVALITSLGMKNQEGKKGTISVTRLNERFEAMRGVLREAVLSEADLSALEKEHKKEAKQKQKNEKAASKKAKNKNDATAVEERKKRVFVLDFDGDIKASAAEELRETVTAVLTIAEPNDEVVVKLESGGGMVHSYGLASSQLARITQKEIPLTVCVDKVAASGGYMMACVADKILAAPFAILGSIGVVAQIPNFHKVLKKYDVDYETLTAGKYKRTLTMLGENTEEGRQKFMEDLEDTHVLFKEFVSAHREQVDIDAVATGEIWFGRRALEQQLIDEISTSDEYLYALAQEADVFEVDFEQKKSLPEKLGMSAAAAVEGSLTRVWGKLQQRYFG
ncbi:protease SohB [Marinagarivorans algicola]|uniref:protease SohB n=1 Tax=Marinagarivorans algicola TaxID=1513270 RepID=UPI0006B5143E|nr:protease SohB [Marinagarivorans algicola]